MSPSCLRLPPPMLITTGSKINTYDSCYPPFVWKNHHQSICSSGSSSVCSSTVLQTHLSLIAAPTIGHSGIAHSFQLFFAFVLGGLFFGTALSVVTAFVALGRENIERAWDVTKTVLDRVWNIFTYGLKSARETLVEGKRWKWCWREAYQVLKEQLSLTKKAAVEGIEAIKLEVSLYSSAVGQPGLIALQYFVNKLTPKLIANMAKENLENALNNINNPNVQRMALIDYDFGNVGPKLMSARSYDVDDAIALDFDVVWDSSLNAKVKVTTKRISLNFPVTIKNLRFDGVVRVVLTPLTDKPPGFGAALISFPKAPQIGLDVSVSAVELTKTPWLRTELLKEIQKAVADEFLWPRRIIVPSGLPPQSFRPILAKTQLDELQHSDPLLMAQRRIDSNASMQKTKLKRDKADKKDLGLDVFVGDEEELKTLQMKDEEKDIVETLNDEEGNDHISSKKSASRNTRFRFPWQRKSPRQEVSTLHAMRTTDGWPLLPITYS